MLRIAYDYKDKLNSEYSKAVVKERNKYYIANSYFEYSIELNSNNWDCIQMVSVDKDDNVLGYFKASVDRGSMSITSVCAINFTEKVNMVFSKDLYGFLTDLFVKFCFFKISWMVLVGNPAESMYDKIVSKYNGRIVGVRKQDVLLYTGERCDAKLYEIFRDDFLSSFGRRSVDKNETV